MFAGSSYSGKDIGRPNALTTSTIKKRQKRRFGGQANGTLGRSCARRLLLRAKHRKLTMRSMAKRSLAHSRQQRSLRRPSRRGEGKGADALQLFACCKERFIRSRAIFFECSVCGKNRGHIASSLGFCVGVGVRGRGCRFYTIRNVFSLLSEGQHCGSNNRGITSA